MSKAIKKDKKSAEDEKFPLPIYAENEDIYKKEKEVSLEEEIDTEKNKNNPGSGLDVPGSELDDEDEKIGEEDEENNYYSLGGDDHEDLEETNDDNR
jgi:hypothetical protein